MEEFLGGFKWSRCQKDSQRPFCLWEVFLEWFPLWFHRSRFELISDSVLDLEQLSRKKPTNPNAQDSVSLGLWLAVWDHVFSAGWSNTFDQLTACVKLSNKSFLWFPLTLPVAHSCGVTLARHFDEGQRLLIQGLPVNWLLFPEDLRGNGLLGMFKCFIGRPWTQPQIADCLFVRREWFFFTFYYF